MLCDRSSIVRILNYGTILPRPCQATAAPVSRVSVCFPDTSIELATRQSKRLQSTRKSAAKRSPTSRQPGGQLSVPRAANGWPVASAVLDMGLRKYFRILRVTVILVILSSSTVSMTLITSNKFFSLMKSWASLTLWMMTIMTVTARIDNFYLMESQIKIMNLKSLVLLKM